MPQPIEHPTYPPPNGDPSGDRCICGGIRHWHAVAPYGCDDCDCAEFRPEADAIRESLTRQNDHYRTHDRTEATS